MEAPQVIVGIGEPPGSRATLRWAAAETVRPLTVIR